MRLLLLLLLIAIAMIVQAPAWLVAKPLHDASSGIAEVRDARGTIWSGAADLALHSPPPSTREIGAGRIEWSLTQLDALARSITIELRQPSTSSPPFTLKVGPGDRADVTGSLSVPVQAIGLVPMLGGWSASGEAVANIARLQSTGRIPNGTVAIRWTGARLLPPDLPGGIALGETKVEITLDGGATSIHARSSGGDVDLAVDAASRTRTVAITLQPRPSASPQVLGWLQTHTMTRTPAGAFRIDAGWP